jgi:hypothetical protein
MTAVTATAIAVAVMTAVMTADLRSLRSFAVILLTATQK